LIGSLRQAGNPRYAKSLSFFSPSRNLKVGDILGFHMSRSALLICNGEPPSVRLARRLASAADLVIAADGGANAARRLGISPHVIIGDLDSIRNATRRFFSSSTIIRVKRQDNTDLEKALDYLQAKHVNDVTIIGATGRRVDFTLGNLSVLWNYVPSMTLTVVGDGWKALPVESGKRIAARPGTTVSLIPFGACSGITLKGLRYTLSSATMRVGEIGVSNVVKRSPISVTVGKGKMLVFIVDGT
jgi:thiamine pyrophosphokinase